MSPNAAWKSLPLTPDAVQNPLTAVPTTPAPSLVVTGDRCDIDSCRLYTYELTIAQKSAGSRDYGVLSLYKTQDQTSADAIRNEDSNFEIFGIKMPPEGQGPPLMT
ncbi:hypothetical protein PHYSODRAFT_332134 [Phytophthora sojae]|uniref:Uncharacterized protein n=1 Tax=Phytophthora sojae (strain P6497) TaxID=1094619 RepID=G4ZCV5_PHYSP|nr:hypothetical protein PHYSODRAFT_332134 [Phytophthora sojae]EGZ18313.1 hypothetical protein PHYSODRAFT_332134 [Phytophthora sojae]|eukprot:XP_009527371.1 hypothetical protein PHYSODRAFT_332134 [Phytophthora sojae]